MTGPELKQLIKVQGYTQQEAADLLNVSRQTLSTWCKLMDIPEADTLLISKKIGQNVNKTNIASQNKPQQLKPILLDDAILLNVPLVKERISEMLKQLYLDNNSPKKDWFLFGNQASLASGPSRFNRNRLSERWRRVLDAGELPTDLKLYGLKHTGADDKIMAGVDLEYLKDLYGHHSTKMTRVYAKKIKEKGAQVIRDSAPDF